MDWGETTNAKITKEETKIIETIAYLLAKKRSSIDKMLDNLY